MIWSTNGEGFQEINVFLTNEKIERNTAEFFKLINLHFKLYWQRKKDFLHFDQRLDSQLKMKNLKKEKKKDWHQEKIKIMENLHLFLTKQVEIKSREIWLALGGRRRTEQERKWTNPLLWWVKIEMRKKKKKSKNT